MFVLCKDVKVYNFEVHYNYQTQNMNHTATKKRKIQVLKSDYKGHNPFRTKGISMTKLHNQKDQNLLLKTNSISGSQVNSKETILNNTRRNNSSSRCMHSIESKANQNLLVYNMDHKKTTHAKNNVSRQPEKQRDNSPEINIQLIDIRQNLLHKPTLSTTLQVTRKCSITNSSYHSKKVSPQRKDKIVQRSGFSIPQNSTQNQYNKSISFGQSLVGAQSRISNQTRRSSINYNLNIFPAKKVQKSIQEHFQCDTRQSNVLTFREKFQYDMKRVQSNQKLECIDISHINLNGTKDYIVEQSFIKQHEVRSNFRQVGLNFNDSKGAYHQSLAIERQTGLLISLKSYRQEKADQVSKELRNYEQSGEYTNILSLYQHSFDHNQHILIKQPYNNRLLLQSGNLSDINILNPYVAQGKQKASEIANIVACMRNALQFLEAKGIWMTWIKLQDIREICGIYKLCNLEKSVLSVQDFVSIQENLKNLENQLNLIWP